MKVSVEAALGIGWVVSGSPEGLAATFIVKGVYSLVRGSQAERRDDPSDLGPDVELTEGPWRGLKSESDFAPYKPHTDILLYGMCRPDKGRPVAACLASVSVGEWKKSVAVLGDRQWARNDRITEPIPFSEMPLDWSRAYGGPGFQANPIGRGFGTAVLPNVEKPGRLITSKEDTPTPAGFAPIPRQWTPRMRKVGSYTGNWVKERFPWPPADFDWSYYNAAPDDQQIRKYLRGDETIVLENIHPSSARFEAQLPGIRPQLFVSISGGSQGSRREAPLDLDTLWIDSEASVLVLLWRGRLPVRTVKMEEVTEVALVVSPMTEARETMKSYEAHRSDLEAKEAKAREDEIQAAARADAAFEAEFAAMEQEVRAYQDQAEQAAATAFPAFADIGIDAGSIYGHVSDSNHALASTNAILAEVRAVESAFGEAPPQDGALPDVDAELDEPEPWTRERCEVHAQTRGSFTGANLAGLDLSDLDFSNLDFSGAILAGACLKKARLQGTRMKGADLSNVDLEEAEMEGADLDEVDLTGSRLVGARMVDTRLDRSVVRNANLARANLRGARGNRVDLGEANLSGASLSGAELPAAILSGAILDKCDLRGARLRGVSLEGTQGPEAQFEAADLEGARAGSGAAFQKAGFRKVRADGSYWEGAALDEADFERASLEGADFTGCSLRGARFVAARLRKARFEDANLEKASMALADLFRGSLERARLNASDLSRANLYEVEFWDASTDGADFRGANLRRTKLS